MTAPRGPDAAPWLTVHGRRHGKTLRAGQRRLLETRLAGLAPTGVARDDNPARAPIDPAALFPGKAELWLEIGFGGGEHLLCIAAARPDVGLIGCEPFVNGVAMFLSALEGAGLDNVRVHADDARLLLEVLPPASVGRVYLLYPDPWPKRRHAGRRFVNADNLSMLARVMRAGAELRLATDVNDYVRHARAALAARDDFSLLTDSAQPWEGWPGTRYEAKALREGRAPRYLRWVRAAIDSPAATS